MPHSITREKAKKILDDGSVRGKPLSKGQRGLFGRIANKKMAKSADGAVVSTRTNIMEGMAEGGSVIAKPNLAMIGQSPAKANIMQGMQEGGGVEPDPAAGLKALGAALQNLEPDVLESVVQALRGGQKNAEAMYKSQAPSTSPMVGNRPGFNELLTQEVRKAYETIIGGAQRAPTPSPTAMVTPTP